MEHYADANGRLRQADLLERDSTGAMLAVGTTEYNDLGENTRSREIDGTITRRTRNALGHFLRTYVGTADGAWTSGQHDPATNNMVLVERAEHGTGVNDAWLPTVERTYRSNPSWAMQYYGAPPSSDPDGYGTSGSAEHQLSRPAALTTNLGSVTNLAQFTYSGGGRRTALSTAAGSITQTLRLGSEVGLIGLDTYGRLADLHFRNASSSTTLFRARYAYDHAGNRLTAELTQVHSNGNADANTHSQLNAYDALGRLIGTEVGTLMNLGGQWSINPATRQRTDSWQLDLLGNWVGGAQAGTTGPPDAGRQITDDVGAVTSILHAVDAQNEITGVTTTNSSGSTPTQIRYDAAGNLTFDGQYFYQYDAWNRLIQVNLPAVPICREHWRHRAVRSGCTVWGRHCAERGPGDDPWRQAVRVCRT